MAKFPYAKTIVGENARTGEAGPLINLKATSQMHYQPPEVIERFRAPTNPNFTPGGDVPQKVTGLHAKSKFSFNFKG